MVEVHRLALRSGMIGVDQNDFGGQPAVQQGVGKRCAHVAGPDDRNFCRAVKIVSSH